MREITRALSFFVLTISLAGCGGNSSPSASDVEREFLKGYNADLEAKHATYRAKSASLVKESDVRFTGLVELNDGRKAKATILLGEKDIIWEVTQ